MQARSLQSVLARSRAVPQVLAAVLALVLLLAATPSTAETASPRQADPAAVLPAATEWLTGQYGAGAITTRGGLADLIFALLAADTAADVVAAARADLEIAVAEYLRAGGTDDGQIAKALLAIQVAGGDGSAVDGVDVEQALRDLEQVDGPDAGRLGQATTFTQALGVMALSTTSGGVPAAALQWLVDRRCPDGGFPLGTGPSTACTDPSAGDVDSTAVAVQALVGASGDRGVIDDAVAWLVGQQSADGSLLGNANSTGLGAQAMRAGGSTAEADAAAGFVADLQIAEGQPDAGAIRYRADDPGSLLLATTQGVLAFGAPALPLLSAEGAPPGEPVVVQGEVCDAGEGVTVVVDLTFFDQGVRQGCAVGDPATGLEALEAAGFTTTTQQFDFGTLVCAIDGLPELECDQPFEGQFWAYSSGRPDGTWEPQQVGADTSDPSVDDVEGWRYGEGEGPVVPAPTPAAASSVARLSGADRLTTAVAISQDGFAAGAATGLVLARADAFADALAGTPLAVAVGGPLLLTPSDGLTAVVADEIQRVLPAGARVDVLGGSAAIDAEVDAQLAQLGYEVRRVAGQDRVTTAIEVARQLGDPATLLITTGSSFPDALAAGTAAAATGDGAVLLTGDGVPRPEVEAYLAEQDGARVLAIGGPAAAAHPDAEAVVGATREETAVAVARTFFTDPTTVGIARRDAFADALAGGAHVAVQGGPLLLTPTDSLSPVVAEYLCSQGAITTGTVYGGQAAITDAVAAAVADLVAGGCA